MYNVICVYIRTYCNTHNTCIHTKMFVFTNGTIPWFEELMREREKRDHKDQSERKTSSKETYKLS